MSTTNWIQCDQCINKTEEVKDRWISVMHPVDITQAKEMGHHTVQGYPLAMQMHRLDFCCKPCFMKYIDSKFK